MSKDRFELTEEEMELIKLRRIRAQEAKKKASGGGQKKKRELSEEEIRARKRAEKKRRLEEERRAREEEELRARKKAAKKKRLEEEERLAAQEEELRAIRRAEKKKRLEAERKAAREKEREDDYYESSKSDDWDDIDAEEERRQRKSQARRNAKREALKRKRKKKRKIVLGIIISIVAAVAVFAMIVMFVPGMKTKFAKAVAGTSLGKSFIKSQIQDLYEANVWDRDFDSDAVEINDGLNISSDYTNIALFGVDSRDSQTLGKATHSDTIMIMSINNKTGETKMASVFRDTYLKMVCDTGEVFYDKANSAYFRGGPLLAVNMLNTNWDLNITDYVTVNFGGIEKIVNALPSGGLELTITDDEVDQINYYLLEQRDLKGLDIHDTDAIADVDYAPDGSGQQTILLDGVHVTAYCRNRYTTFTDKVTGEEFNYDYGRTARQRYVLQTLISTVKSSGVSGMTDVAQAVMSENTDSDKFIVSSMTTDEAVDVLAMALDMSFSETMGFPIERDNNVVPKDLEYNAELMHQYLFGLETYQCTQALQRISEEISADSGVYR